jgi:hypothetical protein
MVVGTAAPAVAENGGSGGVISNSYNTTTKTITIDKSVVVTKSRTNSGIIQRDGDDQTAVQGNNSAVADVDIDQNQYTKQKNYNSNSAGGQVNVAMVKNNSSGDDCCEPWLQENNHSNGQSGQTNSLNNENSQSLSQSNSNSQTQTVSQSATGVSM